MNRLPFFINLFFDTYLLISEDTPVGELAQGWWAYRVAWVGSFPTSERDLRDQDHLLPVTETMVSLMGVYMASARSPPGMGHLVFPMVAHSNREEF